jgi:fermentation-respiration switch protein FrsA (DUF1100 family)
MKQGNLKELTMESVHSLVRTRAVFLSQGEQVVGYFYRPASAKAKVPCVVMAHGFGGTQDRLVENAETFAEAGLAVLTLDYRRFGESNGEPRQVIDIRGQQEDFKSAVRWARSQPEIDAERIALWGSSLGGTHTIFVAAEDHRIAAVVAQVPYAGKPKEAVGRNAKQIRQIMGLALMDRIRGWLRLKPLYVPIVGTADEGAVLVDPHAKEVTASLSANNSLFRNKVAPRIIFDVIRLTPLKVAKNVQAPLLVTIAEKDTEAPTYLSRQIVELAPHGEAQVYPFSHYEIYRPEIRRQVLADQLEFLTRILFGSPKQGG